MTSILETPHTIRQFDTELMELHSLFLKMGGVVQEQLADALVGLLEGNLTVAEKASNSDFRVNKLDIAIDQIAAQIIVRRQPAASDLRLIVGSLKGASDLERIGDEAAKIARLTLGLTPTEHPYSYYSELHHMGRHVERLLTGALDAYARMDADEALKFAAFDPRIDREYEALLRQLMTYMMEDARNIKRAINVMWAVRSLERVGDHARNICEHVIYVSHGLDVRHDTVPEMAARLGRPEPDEAGG